MNDIPADVNIRNLTQTHSVLGIAGPASEGILASVCSADVQGMPFFGVTGCEVGGVKALVMRLSYTGLPGFEVHLEGEYLLGAFALDSMRLEAGFKGLGSDMRKDNPALSAGIQ